MTELLLNIIMRLERIEQKLNSQPHKKNNHRPYYKKPKQRYNNKFTKDEKPRLDNYCDQAMYDADWWKRGEKEPGTKD